MVVTDNNALNSYLKTPPLFKREAPLNALPEIAPTRPLAGPAADRGQPAMPERGTRHGAGSGRRDSTISRTGATPEDATEEVRYRPLGELILRRTRTLQANARLDRRTAILIQLARSGEAPPATARRQTASADIPVQAHATRVAATLYAARTRSGGRTPAG